jgi:hypothetical protein
MPYEARDVIAPRLGLLIMKVLTHDRQGAINVTVARRKPETRTTDGSVWVSESAPRDCEPGEK